MTRVIRIILLYTMAAILFCVVAFLQPQQSMAAVEARTADLTRYNPGAYDCEMPPGQLSQALVECITAPVRAVVLKPAEGHGLGNDNKMGLLAFISQYIAQFMTAIMVLAIMIFGLKVFNVRNNPYAVGLGLLIRIGIAYILIDSFGGFAERLYEVYDELVNLGNIGGSPIWVQIDLFLSNLFGFVSDSPSDIDKGILTLLNGSIFAKSLGIMLTIIGILAVGSVIIFILQAMYLYLISFMAFSFLLAISPLFVIFFVFGYTERFFSKWFELVLASILTPLLMFAFIGIFLDTAPEGGGQPTPGIIRQAVDDVFIALGNGNVNLGKFYVNRCLKPPQPLGSSYLLPTDSNMSDMLACPPPLPPNCSARDSFNANVHTWLNPFLFRSMNYVPFSAPTIDCGLNDEQIKREVFEALLALFIYVCFINAMLNRIPGIAQDLANGISVGASHLPSLVSSVLGSLRK